MSFTTVSSLVRGLLRDHAIFFFLQLLSLAGDKSFQWRFPFSILCYLNDVLNKIRANV